MSADTPGPLTRPIVRVQARDWPALAGFLNDHNRDASGRVRCLHADQGSTVAQLERELAALPHDEAAFWCVPGEAAGSVDAVIGCTFDPVLRRAWLRGPLATPAAAHPMLQRRLVESLEQALAPLHCFDAFPAESDEALNRLYADAGYRHLGVHRVMQAEIAATPADAGPAAAAVQRATPAQLPQVLALHGELFPTSYLKDSDFERSLHAADRCLLVALSPTGQVAGYLMAKDDPEPPEVYIDFVGVADHARGAGLGSALLGAALQWGRSLGRPHAALTVRQDRAAALAVYERAGFRQISAGVHWRKQLDR